AGLSISTDAGATFKARTSANGLNGNRLVHVFASGALVYVAQSPGRGLSVSTDRGGTFTSPMTFSGTVYCSFVDGQNVYVGTSQGLWISADGGRTFALKEIPMNGINSGVVAVYASGKAIYAGTMFGLSVSRDGGVTFEQKSNSYVNGIAGEGNAAYIGSNAG